MLSLWNWIASRLIFEFQLMIRFIKKSGRCNVSHSNLNDRSRRFLADIFTTGVDLQWRWNLFVFGAAFVIRLVISCTSNRHTTDCTIYTKFYWTFYWCILNDLVLYYASISFLIFLLVTIKFFHFCKYGGKHIWRLDFSGLLCPRKDTLLKFALKVYFCLKYFYAGVICVGSLVCKLVITTCRQILYWIKTIKNH